MTITRLSIAIVSGAVACAVALGGAHGGGTTWDAPALAASGTTWDSAPLGEGTTWDSAPREDGTTWDSASGEDGTTWD